jgi:hypothetical protein
MVSCNNYQRSGISLVSAYAADAVQELANKADLLTAAATLSELRGLMWVAKLKWRIPMASWRSKFFAVLLGLVAISFLAGPVSAAPRHHHHHHHHHRPA